jgi:hypothetical protein
VDPSRASPFRPLRRQPERRFELGRRSPQSVLKRAREQALREKRELKEATKAARAAARQQPDGEPEDGAAGTEGESQ